MKAIPASEVPLGSIVQDVEGLYGVVMRRGGYVFLDTWDAPSRRLDPWELLKPLLPEKRVKESVPQVVPHGTVSKYTNHRCRCKECCEAHTRWMREYRAAKKARAEVRVSTEDPKARKGTVV